MTSLNVRNIGSDIFAIIVVRLLPEQKEDHIPRSHPGSQRRCRSNHPRPMPAHEIESTNIRFERDLAETVFGRKEIATAGAGAGTDSREYRFAGQRVTHAVRV